LQQEQRDLRRVRLRALGWTIVALVVLGSMLWLYLELQQLIHPHRYR